MYILYLDLLIFACFCLFLIVIVEVIPKIAPLYVFRSSRNFPYVIEPWPLYSHDEFLATFLVSWYMLLKLHLIPLKYMF